MKIKDIMNKNISSLEPFKYNPESWFEDSVDYISKIENVYRKIPVIDIHDKLLGVVDLQEIKQAIEHKTPPKFSRIPFLYAEDDLNYCKDKIDVEYLNEKYRVFVLGKKDRLVGFIPAEIFRLLTNDKYLYTFIKAINNVRDGIVLVDKDSRILYVNDAYPKILNVEKYKVLNRLISKIEPDALILEVLKNREPIVNTPVKVKSVGKEIIANMCPIVVQNELVGAISIFKDVTEVQTLTRELENMKRLTGYLSNGAVNSQMTLPHSFSKIVGKDEKFLRCLKLAAIAAPTDAAVLIEGESGVGKEVIVEAVVKASLRAGRPFVRINCSAIPENLFESELFGYEGGSFTGALSGGKEGKFKLADGGTIFLDEIGEMPLFMQAKLLRVLQSGEIQKIGSTAVERVDVRVIAATNQDLKSMVKEGDFREDLYFRINTFTINIPPLRERKEDIVLLSQHFLNYFNNKYSKKLSFSSKALDSLIKYSWPGNVRELQSCIEYAVIISQGDTINVEHLPEEIQDAILSGKNDIFEGKQELKDIISEIERKKIIQSLVETGGNRTKAIEKLGMSRRTFYRKLKIYKIDPDLYTK